MVQDVDTEHLCFLLGCVMQLASFFRSKILWQSSALLLLCSARDGIRDWDIVVCYQVSL